MPTVDFNSVNRSVVPDGKYLCRVHDVILKTTNTGKEMWNLHLKIEQEGEYFGQMVFHNLVFGESSLWMVKRFYEAALGREMSGTCECKTVDLIDAYVIVTVKGEKKYNEKSQPILTYFENPQKKSENKVEDEIPF